MNGMIHRVAAGLTAVVLCTAAGAQPAAPQAAASQAGAPEVTLNSLRVKLERMPVSADNEDEVEHITELTKDIVTQAERFVAARTTQLADLNARLAELGPAPTAAGSTEDPDIKRQRAALQKERNTLDADIRLARVLAVDAQQRRSEMLAQRRAVFEAQLLERASSPLRTAFWDRVGAQWQTDQERLRSLANEAGSGVATTLQDEGPGRLLLGALGALALMVIGLTLIERSLPGLVARTFPAGRLRRSLLAVLTVLAYTLVVGLALSWAWETLESDGSWGTQSTRLAESVVHIGALLAFVVGLGRALLANGRSSWRLPPMGDDRARRLAPLPWLFAFVALMFTLTGVFNEVLEAPLNALVSYIAPVVAFAVACVIGLRLLRREPRAPRSEGAADRAVDRPIWLGLLSSLVVALMCIVLPLLATGYLALARTIAAQATWAGIVLASAYLLFKFADDLCMALLSSRGSLSERLQMGMRVAPQTLDQAAVLVSGVTRITLFYFMVIAFVAPLGSSPMQLFQRSGKFGAGFKVGEFELVPGAIFSCLAVLVVGFIVLRLFKRWLTNSYLPHTKLETEMRSSLTTLLGYVGAVLVFALALSAMGIGVERIAWVASALSVGIGFGLQAIVQNFISGLILLAERPVKVGDWVVLGTSEGDVRRINVRATEIQLGDRSTLIVPNSEFITKTVRNMTLANAEGRVLIRLPMPLTADARQVRDIVLGACREHKQVLAEPAPGVTLEGIENGLLIFQAIAYVPSPRMAGGVRSELLFTILARLQDARVPMAADTAANVAGATGPSLAPAAPTPPPPAEPGTTTA